MGAETLDTDGFGGSFNHAPDRPIAQFLSHNTPIGVILELVQQLYPNAHVPPFAPLTDLSDFR
jgi:hypothetical protein